MDKLINNSENKLIPPIYMKTDLEEFWPEDRVFYILASNGLFLCRNQKFFISCIPANNWPSALEEQETFLKVGYPKLPRRLLELAVGFFDVIYSIYRAEAAVLLLWDRIKKRYRLITPPQRSTVFQSWSGKEFPINVKYELPINLAENLYVIGDLHCHCEAGAYSSMTDKNDESYRAGLHIVVGRIHQEPPEFHIESVVDGERFKIMPESILEGYNHRRKGIPHEWINQVEIETVQSNQGYTYQSHNEDKEE
ncbi:hypothetical protein AYK24_07315 [Thermoplasmatales archaeon SG8-52-4]|nr:MAG: hypothetical protein AYK24_07315 [Thermoplasmatales archaeon SG8-52-4]